MYKLSWQALGLFYLCCKWLSPWSVVIDTFEQICRDELDKAKRCYFEDTALLNHCVGVMTPNGIVGSQ